MEKVIAVYDIGKTNKKLLLFNADLKVVFQHEEILPVVSDEDGVECDDIQRIQAWILTSLKDLVEDENFHLEGVNFSTYGATLSWVDASGNLLAPVYNYLKPISDTHQSGLFKNYGGEEEFCRKTASPALGTMLNSGVQIRWMKSEQSSRFLQAKHILHFPQYLSSLLTKKYVSECTSIGCHSFLWDFDNGGYHQWLKDDGISLPLPVDNGNVFPIDFAGYQMVCGVGIHDSSSSLVPYFKATEEQFLLISTGTWCINMNPFNHQPLTVEELRQDCLCYMSVAQKPVKSSRFFLGHIHDVNMSRISSHFGVGPDEYKRVSMDTELLAKILEKGKSGKCFFVDGMSPNFIDTSAALGTFGSFHEAYHQFMVDLTREALHSILLVVAQNDDVKNVFISGGFARNEIFVTLLAEFFSQKTVYTSEVDNASALGAALVIFDKVFPNRKPVINLGLKRWEGISVLTQSFYSSPNRLI